MLLTSADGPSPHAVFAFVTAAQALFGFGCGGEFPVAAASAAERAESTDELKGLRGQTTVLVFSMQVIIHSSFGHTCYHLSACPMLTTCRWLSHDVQRSTLEAAWHEQRAACWRLVTVLVLLFDSTVPDSTIFNL